MTDDTTTDGTVTVARDYEQNAVVLEARGRERRFAPSAARAVAQAFEMGTKVPGGFETDAGQRLASEIREAADDVE